LELTEDKQKPQLLDFPFGKCTEDVFRTYQFLYTFGKPLKLYPFTLDNYEQALIGLDSIEEQNRPKRNAKRKSPCIKSPLLLSIHLQLMKLIVKRRKHYGVRYLLGVMNLRTPMEEIKYTATDQTYEKGQKAWYELELSNESLFSIIIGMFEEVICRVSHNTD
jgi:hypothetical protein